MQNIEYERKYATYNYETVVKSLKSLKFKQKGTFLFRILNYVVTSSDVFLVRLRDEGHRVTFTTKKNHPSGFSEEHEVNVDDFDKTRKLLATLGYKEKNYYEKIREIWQRDDTEVAFDTMPIGLQLMEIEARTEELLN